MQKSIPFRWKFTEKSIAFSPMLQLCHSAMSSCFYLDFSSHNCKQLSSLKIVILDKILNFKHNSSPFRFHLSPFFNFCNGVIEYETPKARKCLLNISSPYWYYNIHILFCLKKKHSYRNIQIAGNILIYLSFNGFCPGCDNLIYLYETFIYLEMFLFLLVCSVCDI